MDLIIHTRVINVRIFKLNTLVFGQTMQIKNGISKKPMKIDITFDVW